MEVMSDFKVKPREAGMVLVVEVFRSFEGHVQNSLVFKIFVECEREKTLVFLWINGSNSNGKKADLRGHDASSFMR